MIAAGLAGASAQSTFLPHWLAVALDYRIHPSLWVTVGRVLALVLAVILMYFATDTRWPIGADRRLVYGLIGLFVLFQEGNQVAFDAPFLLWRLPMILLLEAACFSSMRHYMSGRYAGDVKRRK